MKRIISLFLTLVLTLALIPGFALRTVRAADDLPDLGNMQVSADGVVTWDPCEGAVSYWVYDYYERIYTTSFDLKAKLLSEEAESGDYTLKVSAENDSHDDIALSYSPVYHYEVPPQGPAPENLHWDGYTACWDPVEGASGYRISLLRNNYTRETLELSAEEPTRCYLGHNMPEQSSSYAFRVTAFFRDYLESEPVLSEAIPGRFSTGPITNLTADGPVISWDPYVDTEGNTAARYLVHCNQYWELPDFYVTEPSFDAKARLDEADTYADDFKFNITAEQYDAPGDTWLTVSQQSSLITYTYAPYKIMNQPAGETVYIGETAEFSVTVSGDVSGYQWEYCKPDANTWANAQTTGNKKATLKVPGTLSRDGYSYRCVVTFIDGTQDISDPARLFVVPNEITSQPENVTIAAGLTAEFTVDTRGNPVSYQWEFCKANADSWANATAVGNKTDTLQVPATTGRNGYRYRCVITYGDGSTKTSEAALLTVTAGAITSQPANKVAAPGTNTTFSVETTGTVKSYQWQWRKGYGYAWADSPATGNKTKTVTIAVTQAKDRYQYRCLVTFADDSVEISDVVTLIVGSYTWATFANDNLLFWIDGNTMTISGSGAIPLYANITYQGSYMVMSPWWEYRSQIEVINIEDGVTAIDSQCFMGLSALESVYIPTSVTAICSDAFRDCSSLSDVYYAGSESSWRNIRIKAMPSVYSGTSFYTPTNYLSKAAKHYNSPFQSQAGPKAGIFGSVEWILENGRLTITPTGQTGSIDSSYSSQPAWSAYKDEITSVLVKEGISKVGECAFSSEPNLTSVTLPASLTEIGSSAFADAASLQTFTIPQGVTTLGLDVFYGAKNLSSVQVASGNTAFVSTGGVLFNKAKTKLLLYPPAKTGNAYTVPAGVKAIAYSAFCDTANLKTVTLPSGLTEIGEYAFEGSGITSLTLPDQVFVKENAFQRCLFLTSVTIGKNADVAMGPFLKCPALKTITVDAANPYLTAEAGVLFNKDMTTLITYAAGKTANYYRVPEGVQVIADSAFAFADNLTRIDLPDSLTDIEANAFAVCSGLAKIMIPKNVAWIGEFAFTDCTALTEVHFAGNAPSCGYNPFDTGTTIYYKSSSTGWTESEWQNYLLQEEADTVAIYNQPSPVTAAAGSTAVFRITATGLVRSYQWEYRTSADGSWANATASGNKTRTLKVPATIARNGYQYRCKVTGTDGTVKYSNAAKLTVTGAAITGQPKNVTASAGSTAVFSVTVTGTVSSYQWQYRKASTGSWANATAAGNKTRQLSVPVTLSRNGYQYRCKVTFYDGSSLFSNTATLTVK